VIPNKTGRRQTFRRARQWLARSAGYLHRGASGSNHKFGRPTPGPRDIHLPAVCPRRGFGRVRTKTTDIFLRSASYVDRILKGANRLPAQIPNKFELAINVQTARRLALKELLKKKQSGQKIEAPREHEPSKVVNLMDALRRSVETERAGGERRKPAPRAGHHRAPKKAGRSSARAKKAS
jgi:hypothetical protein